MASRVTVIGAGIFGLSCAWECLKRGAAVRVIEAAHIGAGSSGGTVGALAPHAPENWNAKKQMQLDALVAAERWWAEIAQVGGTDPGYARTGRIQPADPATLDRLHARIAAAAEVWPAPFRMDLTDAPEGTLLPVSASGFYLVDNLTARLSPRRAGVALAAAIRAGGGTIEENAGPQAPDRMDGPAIWATGAAGLAALSADLGRSIGNGIKGQSALLAHTAPDAPQVFAEGLHIVPHADGTVAIGSTSERDFDDPASTDAQLDALIERARTLCPPLTHAPVIDRWAGVRPRAASRAPLLGAWPGRAGHFVANGGFKIGFGMAPAVAALMADLLLLKQDRIPDGFRLQ
ncbi:FAD-binding oxidoreductase [Paracoccus sp. (in: a-proteobacteria)]|uniref:NAD(P)/FAD-dependent oxidoreductase n=1 Tax=Paracoccus sp. TaxID=267 RepID=UPI0026E0F083|nr:FAD-dependent oxidoreductase [Paracoccus sp. (in: a-proteobacteria)]MDO5369013.1 FAD-dependent oxidoreductase [Paracoccus sp. (in: a-proteobacteria)]